MFFIGRRLANVEGSGRVYLRAGIRSGFDHIMDSSRITNISSNITNTRPESVVKFTQLQQVDSKTERSSAWAACESESNRREWVSGTA